MPFGKRLRTFAIEPFREPARALLSRRIGVQPVPVRVRAKARAEAPQPPRR